MRATLSTIVLPGLCALAAAVLSGCNLNITRTEVEAYTISKRDTVVTDAVRNAPGERDNGVIYPSSREAATHREFMYQDSSHERYYPDFLRSGVLELAGFIGTGGGSNSYSAGLFGAYGNLDDNAGFEKRSHTFTGGLVRFMPYERRLRWFRDSPNWTVGTALFEALVPEMDINKTIVGIYPLYFRKRFFLRDQAPYVIFQPTVGVGILPWQYVNAGVTLDVGSWGGLNFRAYAGFAGGVRLKMLGDSVSRTTNFPYFGLGISVLDFVNTVDETQHEWKEYRHHATEITALDVDVIHSFAGTQSLFDPGTAFLTGIRLRFATMEYPLWPIDKHVFIGTTLFNIITLGEHVGGLSVLPVRAGYHLVVLADELTDQPSVEYNYYPSQFLNLSNKLSLAFAPFTINLTIGYLTGNGGAIGTHTMAVKDADFDGAYVAIGAGVSDHIFNLDKLLPW